MNCKIYREKSLSSVAHVIQQFKVIYTAITTFKESSYGILYLINVRLNAVVLNILIGWNILVANQNA